MKDEKNRYLKKFYNLIIDIIVIMQSKIMYLYFKISCRYDGKSCSS